MKQKGFTLIELLVVIAIIGLLASIVLVSLNNARKKARMAKRASDLTQIQKALELYYNDNNTYPNPGWGWRSECAAWANLSSPDLVIPGLVPTYMARFPSDPLMDKTGNRSCYLYLSNGIDYALLDHDVAEYTSADYQAFKHLVDPTRDSGASGCVVDGVGIWSWKLASPGGVCW